MNFDSKENKKVSKYLSFILRHKPDAIDLILDLHGWACIDELIAKTVDFDLSLELLQFVVETNDKQRFKISDDGIYIKANQGHSIDVTFDLVAVPPPSVLLHGTAERFIDSIRVSGLAKQNRHHVHLSENVTVAEAVGQRYGKAIVLQIDAEQMYADGFEFYKTENNVWLVDSVPIKYIDNI